MVVCPLRIGGGIKVKTIEALRCGKAIVSTPIGAQGLQGPPRDALLIESETRGFARAVAGMLRDPAWRADRELRARVAAENLPSWDDAARALSSVYSRTLRRRLRPPADVLVAAENSA